MCISLKKNQILCDVHKIHRESLHKLFSREKNNIDFTVHYTKFRLFDIFLYVLCFIIYLCEVWSVKSSRITTHFITLKTLLSESLFISQLYTLCKNINLFLIYKLCKARFGRACKLDKTRHLLVAIFFHTTLFNSFIQISLAKSIAHTNVHTDSNLWKNLAWKHAFNLAIVKFCIRKRGCNYGCGCVRFYWAVTVCLYL